MGFFELTEQPQLRTIDTACHKMLPFGGQGASCAIAGALELTNLLYDMESHSQKDVTKVFEQYYKSRYETGRTSVNLSNQMGSLMHTKVGRKKNEP